MHLGRDRAGERAGFRIMRPQLKFGTALGEIFENGKAVEHHEAIGPERRNLAGGRVTQDRVRALRLAQADALLGEGDAAMLHGDPRPEAPGGKVLVADEESVAVFRHDPALRHCHCGAPLPLMRPAIKPRSDRCSMSTRTLPKLRRDLGELLLERGSESLPIWFVAAKDDAQLLSLTEIQG